MIAGVIYLVLGIAFILEALDVWNLRVEDLRFVGPIALVLIGAAVAFGSMSRARRST
jgi:hypothetical protein